MPGITGIFGLAAPQFGLFDAKVAINNLDGTFGTAMDVPSVQLYGINFQTVNAQLEGDDVITSAHAKAISCEVNIRFGGIDQMVLALVTGETMASSGTTPNRVHRTKFDGTPGFPWFGMCGRSDSAEDAGSDTHIFVPKMKIMEGFELRMEYGAFAIPELQGMAVRDPDYAAIFEMIEHETATAVIIPPGA